MTNYYHTLQQLTTAPHYCTTLLHYTMTHLRPLHAPSELGRVPGLESDLEYYYGEDWKGLITPSPATTDYVNRLKKIGTEAPELLVAHAYTR